MTLKEFQLLLAEDPSLQKKFKEAKKSVKPKDTKEQAEALSKIIKDLGYDVPESEIALKLIGDQPLDEKELKAVFGGATNPERIPGSDFCLDVHQTKNDGKKCVADYTDTDCWIDDYCDFIRILY